jgi:hypothetical protein
MWERGVVKDVGEGDEGGRTVEVNGECAGEDEGVCMEEC